MLRAVQPVEQVVADAAGAGLRIFVEEEAAFASIQRRLGIGREAPGRARRGEGPVSIVLALPELGQEVEIPLPGHYPVGPEIRGALKAVAGVAEVVEI
jgi:DNA polymerase-3 subunit alpha